jgi:cell division protein FtsW
VSFFLFLVIIPGIGINLLGARRWISIGSFNFQPSEVIKLALAMFLAKLASEGFDLRYQLGSIAAVAFLVMLQPDLGTTIIIVTIGFTQVFVAGAPIIYMFSTVFTGGVLASILILFSEYRRTRLLTFIESLVDPLGLSDPSGSTYHIRQILIALGSGGLFGAGLGHSKQKHLFLPETATDSVFAVISEEIGFLGASILIILLTYYVLLLIKTAKNSPDEFSSLLVTGIAIWIGGQMFLNIASMVALIPITGIPLPFLSYGGTSLTAMLFSIGIVLNISKHEK